MKELSKEEKAKRFDEALEKARRYYDEYKTRDNILYVEDMEDMFPELQESEDERIRKNLIELFHDTVSNDEIFSDYGLNKTEVLAWIEKQGGHQKFRDSIQVGDKVTRNKDGILVNLSQLNRVAKKDNMQGEKGTNGNEREIPFSVWSEVDEEMCQETIDWFEKKCFPYAIEEENPAKDSIKWLKSLKERYTWKPSDLQMKQLGWIAEQNKDNMIGKELMSLYQDLKKLKD